MNTRSRGGDIKLWLAVTAGMAFAGALAGAVWAWIAPPARSVAGVSKSGKRVHDYVGNEADHFFDAAVMMVGLLLCLAIVSAVLVWQFRRHRGPAMVVALTVGGMAAAGAAAGVGAGLVRLRYGHFDIGAVPADHKVHYFIEAPAVFFGHNPLQILTVLLLPAAVAAFTYAVMAAGSAHDNLSAEPTQLASA
ncbi:MAG TPA: DUF2567 domain-containing protein [Mycobacterium sp.]